MNKLLSGIKPECETRKTYSLGLLFFLICLLSFIKKNMFNHLIKIKPIVPLYHLTSRRYFVSPSFISQNKKEGGENNDNHVDNQQNNDAKNHKHTHQEQQNKDAKNEQNKSGEQHNKNAKHDQEQQKKDAKHEQNKSHEKQKKEPSLEDQLKECNSKYKALQVI